MNKLESKIEARNRCNSLVNLLADRCQKTVIQFAGLKVKCATGDWTAKFRKAVEALELPSHNYTSDKSSFCTAWISAAGYNSITLHVRVCYCANGRNDYAEESVYLADFKDHVVVKILPLAGALRTDYRASEILSARTAVQLARQELHAAELRLCNFGEYDN